MVKIHFSGQSSVKNLQISTNLQWLDSYTVERKETYESLRLYSKLDWQWLQISSAKQPRAKYLICGCNVNLKKNQMCEAVRTSIPMACSRRAVEIRLACMGLSSKTSTISPLFHQLLFAEASCGVLSWVWARQQASWRLA